jgi:hypothetical protein
MKRSETFLTTFDLYLMTEAKRFASEIAIGACTEMSSLRNPFLISQHGGAVISFSNQE